MELAVRTDVPAPRPRPPSPRQHVYFALDAETIGLGREYAKYRRRSFGAWLSLAIRDRCWREESVRWWGRHISDETLLELGEDDADPSRRLGAPAPSVRLR